MHRDASRLPERHQTGHREVVVVVLFGQRLAVVVGRDAAHVVVHRRNDRNRIGRDVHPSEDARRFGNAGQPLVQHLGVEMVEVQIDVILMLADPTPFADLDGHRARDDVA